MFDFYPRRYALSNPTRPAVDSRNGKIDRSVGIDYDPTPLSSFFLSLSFQLFGIARRFVWWLPMLVLETI